MVTPRTRRLPLFVASLLGLMMIVAMLSVAALRAPSTTDDEISPAACIGYCAYPRNAGKVFRWGRETWRDEFEVGVFPRKLWSSNRPRMLGQQHGMFTINAKPSMRKVVAWRNSPAKAYGRWEARMRAVELGTRGRHYRFIWRLVPAGGTSCASKMITLASYRPGDRRVEGAVRTPGHNFTYALPRDLRSRAWHAFAIEVTPRHISWFVDTRVVHTERRPAALAGYKLRPQFVMKGVRGQQMRRSRFQMDWVRHYSLERPNARSIKAPRMLKRSYAKTC